MAFVIADRVRETSTTAGTGNFTLAGAVDRFRTFDSVLDTGDTTYYTIADQSGVGWEVGIATFTSPSTLARTTILSSSNGGSAVDFGAGSKDVFITLPASRTVTSVDGGSTGLTPSTPSYGAISLGGTLVVGNGGTGTPTAFTAGSVVFAGASGVYSQDNSNLFWDDTNNRLGVGTTSPDASLTINAIASFGAGAAGAPSIAARGDLDTGMWFPAANTAAFSTGGSERLRIDSSGNVGIGTTSPDALLTVNTVASFGAGAVGAPSIAAKGDLNTGIYFSAADTLDFSTAGTQRGQFDSSGNFKFNSGYGSVATGYGCRAWVNFNGTGTVAIRGSGNVTSITDNGTGDYTVNFTSAMPDANYSISGATSRTNYCFVINDATAPAVGSVRIGIYDASTAALTDRAYVCVNIHR